MIRVLLAACSLLLIAPTPVPQGPDPIPAAMYRDLHWRFIGPYRAGWATVAVGIPDQPNTYYFGAAGGGVWKTTDAGRTWQGLMQHESGVAVGALAIAPSNPKIIYVGTGQVAARYDNQAGDGIYRSNDGGETWTNLGLKATEHIGAILIDPANPDHVLVAALGHVFGPNPERGVYRTLDGGATWQPVLQAGDSVGAVDLAWDPGQPQVVYAAMWQMRMHPWLDYFQPQAGPASGIYKSEDGGTTWKRLDGNGLPSGLVGRIGVAVPRGSGGRIVYASVALEGSPLTSNIAPRGKTGLYRSDDAGATWQVVNDDPSLGSSYFGRVTVDPKNPDVVYVMGRSIVKSTDGGRHFEAWKGSPGGDDYHFMWINPEHPDNIIEGADQGAAVTVNNGVTWSSWYNQPTGQLYHLAADDRFPYHVYSGQQDNGTVELLSRGPYGVVDERDWHPVGGDERDYMIPKPGDPDKVFGTGLGGHDSRFDEVTRQAAEISPWPTSSYGARPTTVKYRYTWITPLAFSPLAPHAMYLGAQVLFKSLDDGDHWQIISPDLSGKKAGATHCDNPPDFQGARDCGFGVIFSVNPSPRKAGLLWVGTDDGLIHVTHDGGTHWKNVTPAAIPLWGRVNDVDPSPFDTNTAYAAIDTHRLDHMTPILLKTADGGKSWTSITTGLPAGDYTTVVRADPGRRGLLYAGTDRGVYVSFDDGGHWQTLSLNLPTTWVRDLLVHDGDLIVATQGRGIWILDDIAPLRELNAAAAAQPVHLFRPATATRLRANENRDTPWPPSTPVAANPPTGAVLDYWLANDASGPVILTIKDSAGHVVRTFSSDDKPESLPAERYFQAAWVHPDPAVSPAAGMHRFVWDLHLERPRALSYDYSIAATWTDGTSLDPKGPLVLPGRYRVTLSVGGKEYTQPLTVRMDPRVHITMAALRQQLQLAKSVDSTLERAVAAHEAVTKALEGKSGADADALRAIADAGTPSLASVAGVLGGLATAVVAADAPPTQGERELLAEYQKQLAGLLARWKALNR